jgi:choline dehydrogenase-like flavoprotein
MDYSLYGTDGPVQTTICNNNLPITKIWTETWKRKDLLIQQDPITGQATGAYTPSSYIDPRGRRSHAGVAYFEPVSTRQNLTLITGALVEKVIFESSNAGELVATGVQYKMDGQSGPETALATREVILSAGAFNSPAILELSGIGDYDLLTSLGIDVILANPNVGENLQDHPMSWVQYDTSDDQSLDSLMKNPEKMQAALQDYSERHTGPLSTMFNAGGVLPLVELISAEDKEQLKRLVSMYRAEDTGARKARNVQREHLLSIILDPKSATAMYAGAGVGLDALLGGGSRASAQLSLALALLHPLSRGSCHIQSSEPEHPPKIDPRYLSHPLDLEVHARHILYVTKLATLEPLASIITPNGERVPQKLETLEDAKVWARENTQTQYHPSGTCSMLPEDIGGVVSERLVVHGTRNLRIVSKTEGDFFSR